MDEPHSKSMPHPVTREDRLAGKLRENLRRRKAQAKAMPAGSAATAAPGNESGESGLSKPENAG